MLKKQDEANNVLNEIFIQLKRNWMAQEELSKDTRDLTASLNKLREHEQPLLLVQILRRLLSPAPSQIHRSRERVDLVSHTWKCSFKTAIFPSQWVLTRKEMTTNEEDLLKHIESGLGCEEDLLKFTVQGRKKASSKTVQKYFRYCLK